MSLWKPTQPNLAPDLDRHGDGAWGDIHQNTALKARVYALYTTKRMGLFFRTESVVMRGLVARGPCLICGSES